MRDLLVNQRIGFEVLDRLLLWHRRIILLKELSGYLSKFFLLALELSLKIFNLLAIFF